MKRTIPVTFGAVILALALVGSTRAETLPPGQVDFGKFAPPGSGGQFVEINVSDTLITLVSHFVEKDQPDVAQLLNKLQLVRVTVIGLDDENKSELRERTAKVGKDLESKGWERIVTARKDDKDVGIYLKTKNKDTVLGLAVMVMDGDKQAVFVNVVGDIKPDQLALLGDKLHIDPLKNIGRATEK